MDDRVFQVIGDRWGIKWQFLKDVYFLMLNDARFLSGRNMSGIRYTKMAEHLTNNYRIDLNERQLRYLVRRVRVVKKREKQ